MEKLWMKLAWTLPRPLVYWCAIRVGCHATTGRWSSESPTDLPIMEALKRWEVVNNTNWGERNGPVQILGD